ncbi:ATP-binding protein [Ammoniphilus resinae]|uniref:Propanediol dehydratase small subunit n=1 Tax=Ammoniphilus resinae TaxID=861532 RepID=A0ABS4GNY4_9BACL|nr:ATP-binding protein [Ammoniphilus resinae]MBP1931985.1 propanediol dehydratase small subunit [Ammoniphilus resinae]
MDTSTIQNNHMSSLNDVRPNVPKGTHPVETGEYLLSTNAINRLFDEIIDWLENRVTGGIVYGRPRLGKTRAIEYIQRFIPDHFGQEIPIFHMRCNEYKTVNENTFFEDLLKATKHGIVHEGKANVKRERLLKYLHELAVASGQKRLVMFIDDAQRLTKVQYNWLMDIYNELDIARVTMTVILVGQEELLHQRSAFITAKQAQIIGRFMVHEYPFSGIKSVDDLQACLSGYDIDSEFPINSGWSFTRYYFPEAFQRGLRLEHYATELYELYKETRREYGMNKNFEIPMQYLTLAIEYVLRKYGVNGSGEEVITMAHWKQAIVKSGYLTAERYNGLLGGAQ